MLWLTPDKTRYPLTSITWPYRGFKFTAHRGLVVFWSWPLTKCWFLIGSQAHVRLTCWKLGTIVQKPPNANPGLKVLGQFVTFSPIQMIFAALFVNMVIIKTQNRSKNEKCRGGFGNERLLHRLHHYQLQVNEWKSVSLADRHNATVF